MSHNPSIMGAQRRASMILLFVLSVLTLTSCGGEAEDVNSINKQTVLVYMPWSGSQKSSGLLNIFKNNLDSIEAAIIRNNGLGDSRSLVFLSETYNSSTLFEFVYDEHTNTVERKTLKTYEGHDYTTVNGIKTILEDVKSQASGLNYAMIVGCHGTGWTFTDSWEKYPYYAKPYSFDATQDDASFTRAYVSNGNDPATRFYGSVEDLATFSTDIPTLAEAIQAAGMKMQYIMFDDCYMANVEVAYELRNATNFMIASTCEVMNVGFPYQTMWSSLARWQPNYSSAVSAFNNFYKNYNYPYGTVAAIDCRKMEELAATMKIVNQKYTLDPAQLEELQVLDGFKTHIFYDFGDYATHLCPERALLNRLESALNSVVTQKANTPEFYTRLYEAGYTVPINTFSGIAISDPSQNPVVTKSHQRTSWYKATH